LLERGDVAIYYEVRGEGFPLLLIAPGGMRSTIDRWSAAAIDPWEAYSGDFRLIAMDQRNAGKSRGPLEITDPWGAYAADQLSLIDSLGVDRFMVMGCCIGGSYVLKLIELAPDRVVAGVLEQPIGVQEDNAEIFAELQRSWAEELVASRPGLEIETVEKFLGAMWRDDFVVSVGVETVKGCPVPLLVLPGIDEYHPTRTGRDIAALAPQAELLEPWKDTPQHVAEATDAVRRFLVDHAQGAA
jgi:pimeloyl-ACP methyl ester carboxylesterase